MKPQSFEQLRQQWKDMKVRHQEEMLAMEQAVVAAARAEGESWGPEGVRGGKRSVNHSIAKQELHQHNREECRRKGWMREDGTEDLERLRLHRKAEKLGISIVEVTALEAKERAKRAAVKFKGKK
jgi:hypothetical protein